MSDQDNNTDQNFNDAELQDIMNEIENLEKEFVEEGGAEEAATEATAEAAPVEEATPVAEAEAPVEAPAEEEVQTEPGFIGAEEEITPVATEEATLEPETVEDNVVSINSAATTKTTAADAGQMTFNGQGQMDMELSFDLGGQTATVTVSGGELNVKLAGVNLSLSENGCEVNMAGGVKFSVPVEGNTSGKKAA